MSTPRRREVRRIGMSELDRIEDALSTKRLDANLFEDCAVDFLRDVYPGLSHLPGGTDSGRDADAPSSEPGVPIRFLITASRTSAGVRANLIRGLESMVDHDGTRFRRLVLANPAVLTGTQRKKLEEKAAEYGATIDMVYDRGFFVSRLRRDGAWRKTLLGLPGHPIAFSELPADLAESQWPELPVVGRDEEVSLIGSVQGDVILSGPPGAGKTRVASALGGQFFVDPDFTDTDRFVDDLRFLNPSRLVVDDAGQHVDLVRRLAKTRRLDADLLTFRLVAVCWPDELDELQDVLPGATIVELPLLERSSIDEIVVAMGVTNNVARQEILDQAEGRPGWAVALADMLQKTKRWESLFDGKVLLGEVNRYLRRAQVPAEAVDLLATIASLGGVSKNELPRVGTSLGLSRPATSKLIDEAAHGGIIDIRSWITGGRDRHYDVRPPMLADALIAEHVFRKAAPTVDLINLAMEWPGRGLAIARAAVNSALLGTEEATAVAHELVNELRQSGLAERGVRELVCRYACINSRTAGEALSWAREEFTQIKASEEEMPALKGIVAVATTVAGRELSEDAAILLLDAAHADVRQWNSGDHPLQEIEQLVKRYHPDIGRNAGCRDMLTRAADKWINRYHDHENAWRVYGAVVPHLLSIHLSARYLNPANQRTLHFVETIVPPQEVSHIYESIWPLVHQRLANAPDLVVREAIDVAVDWRHVGQGHDRPLGREHPKTNIDEAAKLGRKLFTDLVALVHGRPGLTAYLAHSATRSGIRLRLPKITDYGVFYTDVERRRDAMERAEKARRDVEQTVTPWAREDAELVIRRLAEIQEHLKVARLDWPDRISAACDQLARHVDSPGEWAAKALDARLVPAGAAFLEAALQKHEPDVELILDRYLADSSVRWRAIGAVLAADHASDLGDVVIAQLMPTDYKALEWLSFQQKLSLDCQRKLVTLPLPPARGAAALAIARPVHDDDDAWPPREIEAEWLSAIELLDPVAGQGFGNYELKKLVKLLGDRYPTTLYNLISARLDAAQKRDSYLRDDLLSDGMCFLPPAGKTKLLLAYGRSESRWLLKYTLAGNDIEWLAAALDADLLTPEEALRARDGFGGPEPSLRDMAKLLIPRGVPPEVVAGIAQYGTGWGEESERAAALIEEFTEYANDPDPDVAAMGRAGMTMYMAKRDTALRKERHDRVRGMG